MPAAAYKLAKDITLKLRLLAPDPADRPQHLSDFLDRLEQLLLAQDFTDLQLVTRDRSTTFAVHVRIDNTEDRAVLTGWTTFPDLLTSTLDTRTARLTYTHATLATIPLSAFDHPLLEEAAQNAAKTITTAANAAAKVGEVSVV